MLFGVVHDKFSPQFPPSTHETPGTMTLLLAMKISSINLILKSYVFFRDSINNLPSTLDPRPSTLDPRPSTLDPRPSTLDPRPSTLDPRPSTLDPRPSTLDPRPSTLDPRPSTKTYTSLGSVGFCLLASRDTWCGYACFGTQVSSKHGTWYSEWVILQFMCVGCWAGVTYFR